MHDGTTPHHPHAKPPMPLTRPKLDYEFGKSLEHFKVKQGSLSVIPSLVDVIGKVVVSESDNDHISVHFDITASDDSLLDKIKIEATREGIEFAGDAVVLIKQTLNFTVGVNVPKGKGHKMHDFTVETSGLDIELAPSFNAMINNTHLSTTTGNIKSYGSKDKDVVYSPHFYAKSTSGDITGRFPLGFKTVLETTGGSIHANLTSASFFKDRAHVYTTTTTGDNQVILKNDIGRSVSAYHRSVSGTVSLRYPEDVQGSIAGKSTTGDIDIVGNSIKVIKRENGNTSRLLKAIKGDGDSKIRMSSVSGKLEAIVGNWDGDRRND